MKPRYTVSSRILALVASIYKKLGEIKSANLYLPPEQLRRNRIRTIHSSLEIEGNALTVEQLTALLDDKGVLAPAEDIQEVRNAVAAYERLGKYRCYSLESLLRAHALMMKGLVEHPGRLRGRSVGIVKGKQIAHVAPPADLVRPHLKNLLDYVETDDDLLLIKSCVFHYEFMCIHPFTDGNGRIGRLWQMVILSRCNPIFEYLPVDVLIKKRQKEYYDALGRSDNAGNSTAFIEFMLSVIDDSLEDLLLSQRVNPHGDARIAIFRESTADDSFSRSDYLSHFKGISPTTASRDLRIAVERGEIVKSGDGRTTRYRFR